MNDEILMMIEDMLFYICLGMKYSISPTDIQCHGVEIPPLDKILEMFE